MENLVVTNKKILNFYSNNPSVNFEAVNLIFVDLFEHLLADMNSAMNSTINSQILSTVGELKNNVNTLSTSVLNMNNDITNSVYMKFQESKKDYVDDIKNIIFNNFSQNNEKLNNLFQQNTSQLVDKTTLLLNDVIPKSNDGFYRQLQDSISTFQQSISNDTTKLLNSLDKEESLTTFLNNFEMKSNNLLQPLFTYINASEERINKNVISIKESSTSQNSVQEKIMNELSEFLGKYKNSSYKGQYGENQLESVLNQMFPSAEVINTTGIKASCDFRVNRANQDTILFETKNYDRNVTLDEVKKFIRDIEQQKCHGVFLSQHSGITSKQNFQIDIKGTNVLVYVHNVDYCPQTIKIATDIIDSLSCKISELNTTQEVLTISKEMLDDINIEYSSFIDRKSTMIDILKEFQKKITYEINEMKFPTLSKLIISKCGNLLNDENDELICNNCNVFRAKNNKSLSTHKRYCKGNTNNNDDNIVIQTN